jgi:hypothetical protein
MALVRKAGLSGDIGNGSVASPQQPSSIIQPEEQTIALQRDARRLFEGAA